MTDMNMVGVARERKARQTTTINNSTSEVTIVTADPGFRNDLYGLLLSNSGAAATVATLRDATGGAAIARIAIPVGDTKGFVLPAESALNQTNINANWTIQCSVATVSLEVTAMVVKN